jgi:hypothetical protein
MADDIEAKREVQLTESESESGDFGDMLQELRVLLQGVQVLTGFLIVLPFYQGFSRLSPMQHGIYLATFACALASLIIFSAPAAQHRLERPLRDRAKFKNFSTRMIVIGMIPLSLALILGADLVVTQVLGDGYGLVAAALTAIPVAGLWWLFPYTKRRESRQLARL